MLSAFVSLTSEKRGNKLQGLSAQQNEVCQLLHKESSTAHAMGEGDSEQAVQCVTQGRSQVMVEVH